MKTDKQKLQFCFMGNCQTCVIGWALKMMNPDTKIFYICPIPECDTRSFNFIYLPGSFMLKRNAGRKFLSECDFLVYNLINPDRRGFKSWCVPENTKSTCKKLSITSMYWRNNKNNNDMRRMIEKEEKHNIDIRVSKIFQEAQLTKKHLTTDGNQHHHSIIYKKLIPQVAEKLGLHFDSSVFKFLCDGGFPFDRPWRRGHLQNVQKSNNLED